VKAIGNNGWPDKAVIDKSGWNGRSVKFELFARDVRLVLADHGPANEVPQQYYWSAFS